MGEAKRKTYTPAFKAKVGLEAIRGVKTVNEIGQDYGVHPAQVGQWKKEIQEQAETLFEKKRGPQAGGRCGRAGSPVWGDRAAEDGTGLAEKKVRDEPVIARRAWIERDAELAVSRQCDLAGVARSWVYAAVGEALDETDLLLLGLIDAQYTRRPFYGSRRMVVYLQEQGHAVNRKRVQRLMRVLGLAGMAPGPNTSRPHPEHKIYPYLLRGVAVVRPNQVWSTDITYIRLEHGFAYLVAIIDWYARRVLAWRISNTLEAGFCVDCLEDALRTHGRPEVFNSDQGSQFTSEAFTEVLLDAKASPSAWTDAAVPWTTSSSSGCGAASSTRTSTSRAMPVCRSCCWG